MIMNGEIYNYKELREEHKSEFTCRSGSDVEIVPFLYKKYGIEFLHRLNGMFAMAIMDPGAGKYLLVRDQVRQEADVLYKRSTAGHVFRLGAESAQAARDVAPGQDQSRSEYGLLAPRYSR